MESVTLPCALLLSSSVYRLDPLSSMQTSSSLREVVVPLGHSAVNFSLVLIAKVTDEDGKTSPCLLTMTITAAVLLLRCLKKEKQRAFHGTQREGNRREETGKIT